VGAKPPSKRKRVQCNRPVNLCQKKAQQPPTAGEEQRRLDFTVSAEGGADFLGVPGQGKKKILGKKQKAHGNPQALGGIKFNLRGQIGPRGCGLEKETASLQTRWG